MTKQTPNSYKPGVDRLEGMNKPALLAWLEAELRGQTHILAGKEEDYPVQAIVNHHPYLSIAAQQRVGDALEALVLDWRTDSSGWPEEAVRALLSLVAELGVEGAKRKFASAGVGQPGVGAFRRASACCAACLGNFVTERRSRVLEQTAKPTPRIRRDGVPSIDQNWC